MRILIISQEVWRNDQNGGNTLTWMFSGFPSDTEFAQVYCSEGMPNNNVCNNYFKLSTSDVARAIKSKSKDAGTVITKTDNSNTEPKEEKKPSLIGKIKGSNYIRDAVWRTGYYKSDSLKKYILSFNPDIIYAPGYGVNYMNYLIQWVDTLVKCPIVSLISDDFYSFHQKRINPLFWFYLMNLRKNVRKTVKCYDLLYTMTDMQKKQLEKDFEVPVKIIQKGYLFDDEMINEKKVSDPIRIIHVGNLYYNRWKTLCLLADNINSFNEDCKRFQLEVVTSYGLSDKIRNQLESRNIIIHLNVSETELKNLYKSCDIATHVEGFDLINRLKMQMSFSTKIIEYLASGCAILIICDKRQSTYQYLKKYDLAFCVDSRKQIENMLNTIYVDSTKINEYGKKAFKYGKINHSIDVVSETLVKDFDFCVGDTSVIDNYESDRI